MTTTLEQPPGKPPRADERCPLCAAPPNVAHASSCPWLLWALRKVAR